VRGAGRAFTLVELLVSMVVSALVLTLLVSVISRSMQITTHSLNTMAAYSSAAAAVDSIATDLASLAVTRQPYEYLQALPDPNFPATAYPNLLANTSQPMLLILNVISPADSAISSPSPAQSPPATPSYPDSGQPRAVCYRIAWQNPITANGSPSAASSNYNSYVFGLYRQVASSSDTFTYVLGTTDLYAALFKPNPNWNSGYPATPPLNKDFIVGNIVDLQVAFYASPIATSATATTAYPAGSLIQPTVIINAAPGATASTASPYQKVQIWGTQTSVNSASPPPPALVGYGPVVSAEVSLTVIDGSAAQLWGTGSGGGTTSPAALKQKYGHTFTRKVTLRSPE
jgi:prepilin-type N-terminal cleavage/methylation domain-containing protein